MTFKNSDGEELKSEFGAGFTYCLGLFLCHADKHFIDVEDNKKYWPENPDYGAGLWFNAAADHLFDFQVQFAPKFIKSRCESFKEKCLDWRMSKPTWRDVKWAIQEAKDILREYDSFVGCLTIKGDFE